jgi:hypothetical protein
MSTAEAQRATVGFSGPATGGAPPCRARQPEGMKAGIVNAGQIGGTRTTRGLTRLGQKVFVANSRGSETLGDLAAAVGAMWPAFR